MAADGAGDRRPIAARNLALTGRVAEWLIRRKASPDGISIAGMVAGLAAGLCFAAVWWLPEGARAFWLLGAALVQMRLLANLFDGMVAVGRGIASPLGELFNEVPDRVSDTAILLGLGVAAGGNWGLGLAASLAAMATAYIRAVGKAAGAPSDFSGPMAKQQRMALATALGIWCAVTPLGWQSVAGWHLAAWVLALITVLASVTAWRRLSHTAKHLAR
ncbi:CDP-alcohol phosphatidyltransferase [Acetobacteraceae bacterium AT-5844]|nr:CDP-alcohol phosphatidyltransferase [Acetobacteraceae bacterium AT-5844]